MIVLGQAEGLYTKKRVDLAHSPLSSGMKRENSTLTSQPNADWISSTWDAENGGGGEKSEHRALEVVSSPKARDVSRL